MVSLPGIVLIDDTKKDLESLQNSFIQNGYPCFPILYENDPGNSSGIDHVNVAIIKPRIVITDLNLQEQTQPTAKMLVAPIAEVLKKLTLDGPYILYFWSKNGRSVEEVMNIIFERYNEIPLPLCYGTLDKAQFQAKPEELKEKVEQIFTDNPIFNALFGWENKVSSAAQATTNSLFKLARAPQPDNISDFQSKTTSTLEAMLAVIGNEAIGIENAKREPGVAIELGLEPVLRDHIQASYQNNENNLIWQAAASTIGIKPSKGSPNHFKANLNSFYHIEELKNDSPKDKRGSWIEFNSEYLNNTENELRIEKNLGRNIKTLLHEEFLELKEDIYEDNQIYNSVRLGFIELSAECDQAQRKIKLNRYFLSIMIPVAYENITYFKKNSKTAHAGIYRLPNVIIDGEEFIIKISFRYQVGAIPNFNKWLGNPIFKLKDQILSDISFRASQHVTRPGIIRFD